MRSSVVAVRLLSYVVIAAAAVMTTLLVMEALALGQGTVSPGVTFGRVWAATVLVALLATGYWLLELRRIVAGTAPDVPQRRDTFWAVGGWVIPIVSLWFPYQLVADLNRALQARVRGLLGWWVTWLLTFELGVGYRREDAAILGSNGLPVGLQLAAGVVAFAWWCWIVVAFTQAAEKAAAHPPSPVRTTAELPVTP